ncbi:MAG: DUF5667 domain-containing protein [Haloechinothrix sp.]
MNEPWYRRSRDRSERFARALERGATHHDDAEFGTELAVVSALRQLAAEPTADSATRERIRERVLAGEISAPTPHPREAGGAPRPPRAHRGILITATAAGFLGLGLLSIQLSENALPGDFLYDIKRTTEAISLDLTFTDGDKAVKHLELASVRVGELEALVAEHDAEGAGGAEDPAVYRSLLDDFDDAARNGSRSVTLLATQTDGKDLSMLGNWAAELAERMTAIKAGMPTEVIGRFDASIDLLGKIERRADALAGRMSCYQITSGAIDELGARPAEGACTASPASYDLLDLLQQDFGEGGAPAREPKTPEQGDTVPPAPNAPEIEPAPAPAPDPALSPDVAEVEPPADVDDGIDASDPSTTETLTVTPLPTTEPSLLPGLPTVDLP